MVKQSTIKDDVIVEGLNVFNGRKNHVIFRPADENAGLVFRIKDEDIPATLSNAYKDRYLRRYGSFISLKGKRGVARVVEHILAAPYALGIDNLVIELSDGVCPTIDDCTEEFFQTLREIRQEQSSKKNFWAYEGKSETHVASPKGHKMDSITVKPSGRFSIAYYAYYPHKIVGPQTHRFEVNEEAYQNEVMQARSPAFISNGFHKYLFLFLMRHRRIGINERNYLLITSKDAEQYANPDEFGVRYRGQEFVRHKVLDALGALALTGRQFKNAEFNFFMTGHEFDLYALKKLFGMGVFTNYI